jgi:hypothetical protein
MTSIENKPEYKKDKVNDGAILDLLYKQVDRVPDTIKTAVVNVYANRYRINIWQSVGNPFIPKLGKIAASYFVSIDEKGKLKILGRMGE